MSQSRPADRSQGGCSPFTRLVRLPLGPARVRVDRRGLGLGDRGGFVASWAPRGHAGGDAPGEEALTPEAFRLELRAHLEACARAAGHAPPTTPMLNLASHQVVDDLLGWSHLNADDAPAR